MLTQLNANIPLRLEINFAQTKTKNKATLSLPTHQAAPPRRTTIVLLLHHSSKYDKPKRAQTPPLFILPRRNYFRAQHTHGRNKKSLKQQKLARSTHSSAAHSLLFPIYMFFFYGESKGKKTWGIQMQQLKGALATLQLPLRHRSRRAGSVAVGREREAAYGW